MNPQICVMFTYFNGRIATALGQSNFEVTGCLASEECVNPPHCWCNNEGSQCHSPEIWIGTARLEVVSEESCQVEHGYIVSCRYIYSSALNEDDSLLHANWTSAAEVFRRAGLAYPVIPCEYLSRKNVPTWEDWLEP